MRRSEERLGYWLSGALFSRGQELAPGLKKRFLVRLLGLESQPIINEQSLEIGTSTIDLDSALTADANVQDALGAFGFPVGITDEVDKCSSEVVEVDLPQSTVVRGLDCPDERVARVMDARLLTVPNTRFFKTHLKPGMVRGIGNLGTVQVMDGNGVLLSEPHIQGRMSRITVIPHRRASINVTTLQDSERREFLNEAMLLKGVRPESSEIIAVFRHVPIEMVSRLRYFENECVMVYSISAEPRRTRTRVHDMAAVRDNVNGEIHLVPRRTHVNLQFEI